MGKPVPHILPQTAMEVLRGEELARRYPQMRFEDPKVYGIFEPHSRALLARRAVACVAADAVRRGAVYQTEGVVAPAGVARRRR